MGLREMKFRAWDKRNNKLILDGYINKKTNYKLGIDCSGSVIGFLDDTLQEASIDQLENKYIFMQFTGLCDKNGKEIYEGDIIQTPSGRKQVVPDDVLEFAWWIMEYFDDAAEWLEVIGNIYENPELIKS